MEGVNGALQLWSAIHLGKVIPNENVFLNMPCPDMQKRYKKAMIRKRRNQKEIPTPKTEMGNN